MNLSRRNLVGYSLFGGGLAMSGLLTTACAEAKPKGNFPVNFSPATWKKRLSASEFRILRQEGTERPYSSPLNSNRKAGTYICAGCNNPLYRSTTQFKSGTGWPSFYQPIEGGVGRSTDRKLGYARTEIHCARCGGHLGHVFNDGPKPTGKRYCMNGVAMNFVPKGKKLPALIKS